MRLAASLVIALAAGMALGWVYFQALWATVGNLPMRRRPGLWIAGSLILRLGLVLVVFVWLARWGGWPALVAGLFGFVTARRAAVRRVQSPALKKHEESL